MSRSEEAPTGAMGVVTRPWFVLAIVVTCFGILTPKIFIPLFRQMLGLTQLLQDQQTGEASSRDRFPPPSMRSPRSSPDIHHRSAPHSPQHAAGANTHGSTTGGSSSKSMLNLMLPVYAVAIGLYMFYVLFKVFNGKKEEDDTNLIAQINDSDFDESIRKSSRMKFKEKKFELNPMNVFKADADKFMFDPANSEFRVKQKFHKSHQSSKKSSPPVANIRARSEESEDEMNDYARYLLDDFFYTFFLSA